MVTLSYQKTNADTQQIQALPNHLASTITHASAFILKNNTPAPGAKFKTSRTLVIEHTARRKNQK